MEAKEIDLKAAGKLHASYLPFQFCFVKKFRLEKVLPIGNLHSI